MANAAVVVGSSSRIPSFLTSKWTFIVILIRIGISRKAIMQWSEPWIEMVLSNPALQSILVRSTSTLEHWHELQAQYALLGMVPEEYNRKSLLYLFTLPYLEQLGFPSSPAMIAMGIGIFLIVVDFLIAWFIEQLGVYILHSEHKDREELMQPNIPGAIQPNRAAIFGISCDDATSAVPVSIQRSHFPRLGAWIYFCSPLTILCGPQFSFQSLVYLGTIWSCYECSRSKGNVSWAAFVLAVTAYIEPFLLVMALPCYSLTRHSKIFVGLFAGYLASLQILSFLLVGDFTVHLELPVYSHPNLGPLWYFTMHVFPRFRPYFQIMLAGLPYLLVVPLALRLHQYPIVLATSYWCLFTIFHTHPTSQDFTIALALMALSPRSLARTSLPSLIALCALPVPMLLYVLDCWTWLETGSGNANFIYFQCLAYQTFVANICIDFCGASIKRDKVLRMTEKMIRGDDVAAEK